MKRRTLLGAGLALTILPAVRLSAQSAASALVVEVRTPRGPATARIWWEGGSYVVALQPGGRRRRYRATARRADLDRVAQALRAGPGRIVLPGQTLPLTLDAQAGRLRAGRGNAAYEASPQAMLGAAMIPVIVVVVAVVVAAIEASGLLDDQTEAKVDAGSSSADLTVEEEEGGDDTGSGSGD